jgi:hypothetical protein
VELLGTVNRAVPLPENWLGAVTLTIPAPVAVQGQSALVVTVVENALDVWMTVSEFGDTE